MLYPTVKTMEKMGTVFGIDIDCCNYCLTTGELRHCTGCFAAKYCSINCYTKDCLSHGKVCSMLSHLGAAFVTSARKQMPKCMCSGTSLNEKPIKIMKMKL